MKWFVLALAIVMYALVISFKNKKLYFTSAAALLILILGMLAPGKIFPLPEDVIALDNTMSMHTFALTHAFEDIINWNVILIYLGSMILASLFIYSKVPVRLADSGLAMLTLFAMTGILSMFIQSLTALILMTPIALQLCKKRNKNPPFSGDSFFLFVIVVFIVFIFVFILHAFNPFSAEYPENTQHKS